VEDPAVAFDEELDCLERGEREGHGGWRLAVAGALCRSGIWGVICRFCHGGVPYFIDCNGS
jgi:hypothetical protein